MGFSFENLRFELSKCFQNRRFWAKCARRSRWKKVILRYVIYLGEIQTKTDGFNPQNVFITARFRSYTKLQILVVKMVNLLT